MNHPTDLFRSRNDGVVIPRIWVATALSILLHIIALWELPQIKMDPQPGPADTRNLRPPLTARLAPLAPPAPPSSLAPPQRPPQPPQRAQRPKAVPQPTPPVIALKQPAPDTQSPVPRPASPAVKDDLAAYIEARRGARADPAPEPAPPVEDDEARRKRIIAGNLGSERNNAFGYDPRQGGGVFQIQRLSYDYAEFLFYGWNKDISRNTKQLIEVRRGNNNDIRIAVVRKMVSIIREYEKEDFLWVSHRLGRSITLSARARDNAGLEEFMMREFLPEVSPSRR